MSDEQNGSIWDELGDPSKIGFSEKKSIKSKRSRSKKAPRTKSVVPQDTTTDARLPKLADSDDLSVSDPYVASTAPRKRTSSRSNPRRHSSGVVISIAVAGIVGLAAGYVIGHVVDGNSASESIASQSKVNPNSGWLYVDGVIKGIPGNAMDVLDRGFAEPKVKELDSIVDGIAKELSGIIGSDLSKIGKPVFPSVLNDSSNHPLVVQATTASRTASVDHDPSLSVKVSNAMKTYAAQMDGWSSPDITEQDGGYIFITGHKNNDALESWTVVIAPDSDSKTHADLVSVNATSSWHVLEGKTAAFEKYVVQQVKAQHKAG